MGARERPWRSFLCARTCHEQLPAIDVLLDQALKILFGTQALPLLLFQLLLGQLEQFGMEQRNMRLLDVFARLMRSVHDKGCMPLCQQTSSRRVAREHKAECSCEGRERARSLSSDGACLLMSSK